MTTVIAKESAFASLETKMPDHVPLRSIRAFDDGAVADAVDASGPVADPWVSRDLGSSRSTVPVGICACPILPDIDWVTAMEDCDATIAEPEEAVVIWMNGATEGTPELFKRNNM